MGTERRLILMDEFDFNYKNFDKKRIRPILDKVNIRIEADIPYMLILNIERADPKAVCGYLKSENVYFDSAYYQEDNNPELIRCHW